jgi:hypothetical protein
MQLARIAWLEAIVVSDSNVQTLTGWRLQQLHQL